MNISGCSWMHCSRTVHNHSCEQAMQKSGQASEGLSEQVIANDQVSTSDQARLMALGGNEVGEGQKDVQDVKLEDE